MEVEELEGPRDIDIAALPVEIREHMFDIYMNGLRLRLDRWVWFDMINAFLPDALSDWVAHMLQYPMVKPRRAIALVGATGSGKSLCVRVVELLLGDAALSTRVLDPRELVRCNGRQAGATLVHLDDYPWRARDSATLDSFISDHQIVMQDSFVIPSYHRLLITTYDPPPSQANARRFTIIPYDKSDRRIRELVAALQNPAAINGIRQVLMQRNVPQAL